MGFKKVAELVIQGVEDRLTVSSILIKNGYTVWTRQAKAYTYWKDIGLSSECV